MVYKSTLRPVLIEHAQWKPLRLPKASQAIKLKMPVEQKNVRKSASSWFTWIWGMHISHLEILLTPMTPMSPYADRGLWQKPLSTTQQWLLGFGMWELPFEGNY